MLRTLCFLLFLANSFLGFSQDEKFPQSLTAGVEFRPIFPASFLNTGKQKVQNDSYRITVSPTFGFSAGMTVRYGFHKRFALETGINFVQRNYDLNVNRDSVAPIGISPGSPAFNSNTDFTIIGYEHPIKVLFFVQLSKRLFMNAAAGFQFTFFPSDIYTTNEESNDNGQVFQHYSERIGIDGKIQGLNNDGFIHAGGMLNLGMEYRTKKSGYFYLGGTYHVPFSNVYRSRFEYTDQNSPVPIKDQVQEIFLNGSYLTFDIRYFFHSQPLIKKDKKKRKKNRAGRGDSDSNSDN